MQSSVILLNSHQLSKHGSYPVGLGREIGGEAVRDGGPHKYIYQKKNPSFGRMIFLY